MNHPPPDDLAVQLGYPVLRPADLYDEAAARLARRAAVLVLEELKAAGITVRLDGKTLRVGPRALVVNGTAVQLERWLDRLVEVLREEVK